MSFVTPKGGGVLTMWCYTVARRSLKRRENSLRRISKTRIYKYLKTILQVDKLRKWRESNKILKGQWQNIFNLYKRMYINNVMCYTIFYLGFISSTNCLA